MNSIFKWALLLSYEGTQYRGWQKQKGSAADGGPSVQSTIEAAIERMTQEKVSLVGSGRTDSGVHAGGQVAHLVLKNKEWDPGILRKGLNSLLPMDIRVIAAKKVALDFHAQRSAIKKQYSYYFQQGPAALPHLSRFSWWIQKRLDLDQMREGLAFLRGEHDFKPFQASGAPPDRSTVRKILEADIEWQPFERCDLGLVRVRLIGTGFLKQMVRGIAGTLLEIGENRRPSSCFEEILSTGERSRVGPTAPGRALWLERVWYRDLEF